MLHSLLFSLDYGEINTPAVFLFFSLLCSLNFSSLSSRRIFVLLPLPPPTPRRPNHLGDNSLLSCPYVLSGRIQVSTGNNTPLHILDLLLVSPLLSILVRG